VNGIGTAFLCDFNDPIDGEVALSRGSRAYGIGVVCIFDVKRLAISLGVYGHRFDVQFATSAGDSNGDFTAIGDQDALEHPVPLKR
jgi:hypothetical protein